MDPYKIEGNPSDADYIFLTHDYYDHFSPSDINKARYSIYISGDMVVVKEAMAVKCDIAMVPVGGFYTTNYKEAAELVNNSVQVDIKLSL